MDTKIRRTDVVMALALLAVAAFVERVLRQYLMYYWLSSYVEKAAHGELALPRPTQAVIDLYTLVENGFVAWAVMLVLIATSYWAGWFACRKCRPMWQCGSAFFASLVPCILLDALLVVPVLIEL